MRNINPLVLAAASLLLAVFVSAQGAPLAAHERRQALIEGQMASEAALTRAERAAVAAVRADLRRDEAQQRVVVRGIRQDYRALKLTMTARHAADMKALRAGMN